MSTSQADFPFSLSLWCRNNRDLARRRTLGQRMRQLWLPLVLTAIAVLPAPQVAYAGLDLVPFDSVYPYGAPEHSETWTDGTESLLVVGHGLALQIFTVDDPSALGLLGEYVNSERIEYLDISPDGDMVALSDRQEWVTLIDISDRAQPSLLGRYRDEDVNGFTGRAPFGLKFGPNGSDLLYVAMTPAGLWIVDIQDPQNPVLEGSEILSGVNFVFDVELLGSYAFLAEGANGLTAIDVSDPAAPTFSSRQTSVYAVHLTLDGSRCYVATYGDGFQIIDLNVVGSPAAFTLRGSPDLSATPAGFGLVGRVEIANNGTLLAADGNFGNGLLAFDVSSPDAPVYTEAFSATPLDSLSVLGDVAYTLPLTYDVSDPQLRSVQLSVPGGLTELDSIPLSAEAVDVEFQGQEALVSYGRSGVLAFDLDDVAHPTVRWSFRYANKDVVSAVLLDDVAVVAYRDNEVGLIDASDPLNPNLLPPFTFPGGSNTVAHLERFSEADLEKRVYVPVKLVGTHLIDFSDAANPQIVGTWNAPSGGEAQRVSVFGDQIAISGYVSGTETVWLVDFSNPAVPVELGSLQPGFQVADLQLSGDRLYLAAGTNGLRIWDVSTPNSAFEAGAYAPPSIPIDIQGVKVNGSLAYLASSTLFGMLVVGVIDAANPVLLDAVDTPGQALKIDGNFNYLVVADFNGGVAFSGPEFDPPLFSDGFESGDTTVWSSLP